MIFRKIAFFVAASRLALTCLAVEPQQSQIEQSRQFGNTLRAPNAAPDQSAVAKTPSILDATDTSFGEQQVFKRQEREHPFTLFGDVSGFYTSNAALVHKDAMSDAFLVTNFGLAGEKKLTDTLSADAILKGSIFRYATFSALDFESLNAGGGLTYRMPRLWNATVFARYDYTDLLNSHGGDTFFKNHTFTVGAQKVVQLTRAYNAVAGITAQLQFSDPKITQRNEYAAYAGYHVDVTRHFAADLLYRIGYYDYLRNGRRDLNQSATLSFRYIITKAISITAATYASLNRSNQPVFSYNVLNLGAGLTISIQF